MTLRGPGPRVAAPAGRRASCDAGPRAAKGICVDQSAVEQCQELIGYEFNDPELLNLALTHASVASTRIESNERLEFLGDAVLGLVVCHELYERFESLQEGEMTKIKSSVVSRQSCAEAAHEMDLCEAMILGKGLGAPGQLPTSVAAAVLESIIGAIYIDGGLEPARIFILRAMNDRIDEMMGDQHKNNHKSHLQQHAQRAWGVTPEYHLLDEKGPDHNKAFEVAVSIDGRHFPSAWGLNKKVAEQEAARKALVELELVEEDEEDPTDAPA